MEDERPKRKKSDQAQSIGSSGAHDEQEKKQKTSRTTRLAEQMKLQRKNRDSLILRRLGAKAVAAEYARLNSWASDFLAKCLNQSTDGVPNAATANCLSKRRKITYKLRIEEADSSCGVGFLISHTSGFGMSYNGQFGEIISVTCGLEEATDLVRAAIMLMHPSCKMESLEIFFSSNMNFENERLHGNCYQWWNDAIMNKAFRKRVSTLRFFRFASVQSLCKERNEDEKAVMTNRRRAPAMDLSMCQWLVNVSLTHIGLIKYPKFAKFRYRCNVSLRSNQIEDISTVIPHSTGRIDASYNTIQSLPRKMFLNSELTCSCMDPTHRFVISLRGNSVFDKFYEINAASGKLVCANDKLCPTGEDYLETDVTDYIVMRGLLDFAITRGIAANKTGPWSMFLTVGLYDPRLFLIIWKFVTKLIYME